MGFPLADEILARRAAAGQLEAFAELVERHRDRVYRVCLHMAGNTEDAEDWVQECFVRLYRQIGHFDPSRPFLPWLLRVVSNSCINLAKRRTRQGSHEQAACTEGLPDPMVAHDPLRVALAADSNYLARTAIDALAPLLREALILRVVEDLTFQELADVLGVPLQTAATRVRRALEQVRRHLICEGVEVQG